MKKEGREVEVLGPRVGMTTVVPRTTPLPYRLPVALKTGGDCRPGRVNVPFLVGNLRHMQLSNLSYIPYVALNHPPYYSCCLR